MAKSTCALYLVEILVLVVSLDTTFENTLNCIPRWHFLFLLSNKYGKDQISCSWLKWNRQLKKKSITRLGLIATPISQPLHGHIVVMCLCWKMAILLLEICPLFQQWCTKAENQMGINIVSEKESHIEFVSNQTFQFLALCPTQKWVYGGLNCLGNCCLNLWVCF